MPEKTGWLWLRSKSNEEPDKAAATLNSIASRRYDIVGVTLTMQAWSMFLLEVFVTPVGRLLVGLVR